VAVALKERHSLTPNKVGSYESNVVAVRLVFFDPRRLLSYLSACLSHVVSPLGRKDCQSGNLGRTLHWSGKRTETHSLPTGDFWNEDAFSALEQEYSLGVGISP
jgi:hypothetical protein